MPELRFEFDWVGSEGVRGPELAETWASLKIVVGDSVITRVLDNRAKTVRDSVYVPLYPLAEWFAENWWFLANEFQNPERQNDREFHRRHCLNTGREGYAFPNLEVTPSGAKTALIWKRYEPQWAKVEFLDQGRASVDKLEFLYACGQMIDAVVRRLTACGIEDTLLHEEWAAIQATEVDEEELKFCETAAGLGWDPYDLNDSKRDDIFLLADELGELIDEAVQAVNAADLRSQAQAIVSAIKSVKQENALPLHGLRAMSAAFSREAMNEPPWHVGYEWARHLRQELGLDGQPLATIGRLAEALGEDEDRVRGAIQPAQALSVTHLIDGIAAVNADESASFAFRKSNEQGLRFSFCRALAEVLTSSQSRALLTRSHSERQQRNRAFAAEFLAPSLALKERVKQSVVDAEEIDELAEQFGVSWMVIKHQVENHKIADVTEPIVGLHD